MVDLANFVSPDMPFGPIDSRVLQDEAIGVVQALFSDDNALYHHLNQRPSIIVGRKGAGKTSFIQSFYFNKKFGYVINTNTSDLFSKITVKLQEMHDSKQPVFVEQVADIWFIALWTSVFSEILKFESNSGEQLVNVKKFILSLPGNTGKSTWEVALRVVDFLISYIGMNGIASIASDIKSLASGNTPFAIARREACAFLEANNQRAVVIIDSLDDYRIDINAMSDALAGLLHLLGRFNITERFCEVRFCIPAEMYHTFRGKISKNSLKDFGNMVTLHWHAGELIKLAARRFKTYLLMYNRDLYDDLLNFNLSERSGAEGFLRAVLPSEIENNLQVFEDPLAYIMRHSQLIPRQFLSYLNAIFRSVFLLNPKERHIPEYAIIAGVRHNEAAMCSEVFNAFSYTYPTARESCEAALPELPLLFDYGDLHRVFNHSSQAVLFGRGEINKFKTMLIEIGAIGRVLPKYSDRYISAEFEYIVRDRLIVSKEDQLCIHPMFSRVYGPANRSRPTDKVIYPYGSDPSGVEYRKF